MNKDVLHPQQVLSEIPVFPARGFHDFCCAEHHTSGLWLQDSGTALARMGWREKDYVKQNKKPHKTETSFCFLESCLAKEELFTEFRNLQTSGDATGNSCWENKLNSSQLAK